MKIGIYDANTLQNDVRSMTDDEIAEKEQQAIDFVKYKKEIENRLAGKLAILEKLGLTEDEAEALFN